MTPFALALRALGLEPHEAASLLGVRRDTVGRWMSGKETPPDGVFAELDEAYRVAATAGARALSDRGVSEAPNDLMLPPRGCPQRYLALLVCARSSLTLVNLERIAAAWDD